MEARPIKVPYKIKPQRRLIPATATVGFLLADFGNAFKGQLCLLASLPSHGPHKFSGSQSGGEKEGERDEEMEKKKGGGTWKRRSKKLSGHSMSFDLA